jgi:aspartyl/asparaginyl beta-hydroxylase (cupin superfamily)
MIDLIGVVMGIMGLGAIIFTALRYRREDTGALVEQATKLVTGMDTLNEELRLQRDEEREENQKLRAEVASLRDEIRRLREAYEGRNS